MRRLRTFSIANIARFNSRTLGRVRPLILSSTGLTIGVSIHAPWEGCDPCRREIDPLHPGFNSRTLGRVRLNILIANADLDSFNSRTLGRVRPITADVPVSEVRFQFTHPGKGATSRVIVVVSRSFCFNSRTLGRVRRTLTHRARNGAPVSIHAPWEGCDKSASVVIPYTPLFQFTHPGKGAT